MADLIAYKRPFLPVAQAQLQGQAFAAEGVETTIDRIEALLAAHREPFAPRSQPLPVPPHKQQAQPDEE